MHPKKSKLMTAPSTISSSDLVKTMGWTGSDFSVPGLLLAAFDYLRPVSIRAMTMRWISLVPS
jgi:hypothetical protein